MTAIRTALIGLGKMGISHQAIINAHPDLELVAVCDTTSYVLDVLRRYIDVKCYTDYRRLLDQERLDAIVTATPSRFHGAIVREALDRDLHVFCEKPFCLDVSEGQGLADLAEQKGVVNQVGYHYRFVGAFEETKRLVEAGAIGKLHHVRAEAYGGVVLHAKGATWRQTRSEGGGCLFDYACHAIDLLNFILGPPKAVDGCVLNKIFSRDVDDEVYATLHYSNGCSAQVAANWSDDSFRKMTTKLTLWGSNGRIFADRQEVQVYVRSAPDPDLGLSPGWNIRYTTELTADVWFYLRGEEYSAQIDHFAQSIKTQRPVTRSSFRSAVETDRVLAMIIEGATSPVRRADGVGDASGQGMRGPLKFWRRLTGLPD